MHTETTEIYLPDDLYNEVVNRLAEAMPLFGGRDELVTKLGEITGIWPEYAKPENFEYALAS